MPKENKRKFALWIRPKTIDNIKKIYRQDNCQSISEFVEKAVLFYIGYLAAEKNIDYFSTAITKTVEGIIGNTEKRLSTLAFKQAVGNLVVAKTLALYIELEEEQQRRIYIDALNDAKKINGSFPIR